MDLESGHTLEEFVLFFQDSHHNMTLMIPTYMISYLYCELPTCGIHYCASLFDQRRFT